VRVPVPDEYESPSATYFVAHAELAKAAKNAITQRTAEMRLQFILLLPRSSRMPSQGSVGRKLTREQILI
jgi:hypothetical protein